MNNDPGDKVTAAKPAENADSSAMELAQIRLRIAVAAACCLTIGFSLWLFDQLEGVYVVLIRVGVLGATGWLAFPTLSRIRWRPRNQFEAWALSLAVTLVAVRPRVFLPLAVVLGLILLFKIPGSKKKPDSQSQ